MFTHNRLLVINIVNDSGIQTVNETPNFISFPYMLLKLLHAYFAHYTFSMDLKSIHHTKK